MRRRDPEAGAHGPASSVSRSGDAANPTLQLTVPVAIEVSPLHHRDCFLFLHEVSESVSGLGHPLGIGKSPMDIWDNLGIWETMSIWDNLILRTE